MVKIDNRNITFLISSLKIGGVQKVTLLLINELCKRGWKVSILVSISEGFYLNKLDKRVRIISLKNRNISKNVFEITRYLRRNPSIYFYSSMTYVNVIAVLAILFSRFKGKVIFSEHSNLSKRNLNNKNFINKFITFLAKRFYKKADAIVCVSEGVKSDLMKTISNLKRCVVIYNPVENLYKEVNHNYTKFKIISVGRMDKEKNFSLLINAFSIVLGRCIDYKKDLQLYILGDGSEKENLQALIEKLNLSDKIFLPGFVDQPSVLLSASDLFVLSSNREGFGNVLVEALSCGVPVISTDCPSGPSEILDNGQFGKLVPVNDVESMADAIIDAIINPYKYSTKEERIRRAQDFSVEKIVNEYELLFQDLLSED